MIKLCFPHEGHSRDTPDLFLGIVVPMKSGVIWMNNPQGLYEPCEQQVEGIYIPLLRAWAVDLYALDGYFEMRPKHLVGTYDPEVVEQFLSSTDRLPFAPLDVNSPFPLYRGWIPLRCKADPGDTLLGPFYDRTVILVYSDLNSGAEHPV